MKIHEYQARKLFSKYGIPVPEGEVCRSVDEVKKKISDEDKLRVVKAQVHVGGRGKAGGVKLAFENHDHAYKRTFPIKNNKIDREGIVYIGDGSWGTRPREVHKLEETWYLQKAQSIRAFTLVTLQGSYFNILSIDEDGNLIDSYPQNPLQEKMDAVIKIVAGK